MAKEKLFTPEDFDKPTDKKWYQTIVAKIVFIIIVLAIIVGVIIYFISGKSDNEAQLTKSEEASVEAVSSTTLPDENIDSTITEVVAEDVYLQADEAVAKAEEIIETTTSSADPQVSASAVEGSTDTEALKVIRGDYGNIPQRKELLGARYTEIQSRVNQLKKEGKF